MHSSQQVDFVAQEYQRDTSLRSARYSFKGSPDTGWIIERDDALYLELGPGFRLLRTQCCGVCATDLDRHHLPFPLPQITGHEVVACDVLGTRYVVEINASHASRGVTSSCPFCRQRLDIHCPQRKVIGIHALPGGFGAWILAPVKAALALPESIPSASAVLVEPFAAALKAVTTIGLRDGDSVAVLGPRRLGMLIVAALAGHRRAHGPDFSILALSRHSHLVELAVRFGADRGVVVTGDGSGLDSGLAEVVIDSTGTPSGMQLATRLARRELHVKSTHGQSAAGLEHLTQMVVDEIALDRLPQGADEGHGAVTRIRQRSQRTPLVAWLSAKAPPAWLADAATVHCSTDATAALEHATGIVATGEMPRADVAVVDSAAQVDSVIRPDPAGHHSLLRPTGEIWLNSAAATDSQSLGPLLHAVARRGLRVSSSRCGSFELAVSLLSADATLTQQISELITHRLAAEQLDQALSLARSPHSIKVVVEHPEKDD